MMKIGQVATQAGMPASAIRFYESLGILPRPARRNGVRVYDRGIIEQLRVLRFFRSAGVSTEALAGMFAGDNAIAKTQSRHAIVFKRIGELDELIAEARSMKRRLKKLLDCRCEGDAKRCVIFKEKPPTSKERRRC
jgi:MerR family redox-sensitive transcriptional activator SoxR